MPLNKIPISLIGMKKSPPTTIYHSNFEYPSFVQNEYSEYDIRQTEVFFAVFMVYAIIPLLYTAFLTNNIGLMTTLWNIVHSGIFNGVKKVKQFLSEKIAYMMRYLGYYTFSTYTVVKNGRELFSSHSEFINIKTYRQNIKTVDMAKYKVCKWIDAQCSIYKNIHNETPEISDAKNVIYDFIIHSSPDYKQTRIHRGDFRISTHTQFDVNYRTFSDLVLIDNYAELIVDLPHLDEDNSNKNKTTTQPEDITSTTFPDPAVSTKEVIPICIKSPDTFYIEKNELFDRAFLQWYLLNKLYRPDIVDYIGTYGSEYETILYNKDFVKCNLDKNGLLYDSISKQIQKVLNTTESDKDDNVVEYFMKLTQGQHIIVGKSYIVKVDTKLNCPIYNLNDKDIIDIDGDIQNYYSESEASLSDNESAIKEKNKTSAVKTKMNDDDDNDEDNSSGVSEEDTDDDADQSEENVAETTDNNDKTENITSEFEMIE